MINFFEERKKIDFEDLPKAIKDEIWSHFKSDFQNDLEELLDFYSFSMNTISFNQNMIVLPSTYFDMRGDGGTYLCKELLQNLKEMSEIRAYAVECLVCEKLEAEKNAYAVYELDNH